MALFSAGEVVVQSTCSGGGGGGGGGFAGSVYDCLICALREEKCEGKENVKKNESFKLSRSGMCVVYVVIYI